mmetsp:Transcript_20454/g.47334  ORF Transcript_20454/g.47334 Transcript_20454/m.47334 type:complete len:91 (-) Transcript_20454:742-1014(-)
MPPGLQLVFACCGGVHAPRKLPRRSEGTLGYVATPIPEAPRQGDIFNLIVMLDSLFAVSQIFRFGLSGKTNHVAGSTFSFLSVGTVRNGR